MKAIRMGLALVLVLAFAIVGCKKEDEEPVQNKKFGDTQTTTVDTSLYPAKLAFSTTADSSLTEFSCATMTVVTQNSDGNARDATQDISLSLSATNGQFFSDTSCGTQITSTSIANGSGSATFYYNSKTNGSDTVTVADTSGAITSTSQSQSTSLTLLYTWKNSCREDSSTPGDYVQDTFVFSSDGTFTWSQYLNTGDTTCAAANVSQKVVAYGTWTLGDYNSTVTTARNLTYTYSKLEMTVYNTSMVTYFNSNSVWGFTDWAIGVTKDVTGISSGASTGNIKYSSGDVDYDLYKISNSQLVNSMTFLTRSTTTPTSIGSRSTKNYYTKQ